MTARMVKWLAWSVALSAMLLSAASAIFVYLNRGAVYVYWASNVGGAIPSAIVGALILTRLPRHRIGWLFCVIGILGGLDAFAAAFGAYALTSPTPVPGGIWFAWLAVWFWLPLVLCYVLLLLIFPTGQPLSPRWSVALWAAALGAGCVSVASALFPGRLMMGDFFFDNPFGLPVASSSLLIVGAIGFALFFASMAAAVASLILRLLWARGQERQQLKWFVYAGVVALLLAVPSTIPNPVVNGLASVTAALVVPAAAGIAILRYRLYDIDIIIHRTLTFSVLTVMLALVYFGSVVVLQQLFSALTGQGSEIAVIISTLGIAALFNPIRHGVQNLIDRRFYRRKYDAHQVLAKFGLMVRDEVDLNRLTEELLGVVEETMQPASVSLWLTTQNKIGVDKERGTIQ